MRNTARRAATRGLAVTDVCGPLAGTSPAAAPASLHAPSALVLPRLRPRRRDRRRSLGRLSYERTFANECLKNATGAGVFAF
ncbi:hypothetical protein KVH28_11010 [Streptomyces olivaceus]|nr:hypothetical protein [Streptomyces olivaceus]